MPLGALLVWTLVMTSIGRACANPIDDRLFNGLALWFLALILSVLAAESPAANAR
ncbi:MAG TPA: hypothetical protein VF219_11325 [Vicinamibacterales bacterium]